MQRVGPIDCPSIVGRRVAGEPEVAASEASDMRPGERVGDPTLGWSYPVKVAKPSMSACKGPSCVIPCSKAWEALSYDDPNLGTFEAATAAVAASSR